MYFGEAMLSWSFTVMEKCWGNFTLAPSEYDRKFPQNNEKWFEIDVWFLSKTNSFSGTPGNKDFKQCIRL